MGPRTILYTGKGGVGKTSVAAATGRRCAAAGLRTLVLSTDPAHSLAEALGEAVSDQPTAVAGGLWAQQVEPQAELERNWSAVQGWLGGMLTEHGMTRIAAEELSVPPGGDELFSLLELKRHHESGAWDVVVVDCAPTGETLRLLSFPDVARWWLGRVLGREAQLLSAARPIARTFLDLELPDERVWADVQRLMANLVAMNAILRDRERVSLRLVMTPDRMVVAEAMRTFTYLNLYGYLTDAVVVNRVFPDEVADTYFGAWRELQHEQLALVDSAFAPSPSCAPPTSSRRCSAGRCSTGWAPRCSRTPSPRPCCTPRSPKRSSSTRTVAPSCGSSCPSPPRGTSHSRRSDSSWSCGSTGTSARSCCRPRWPSTGRRAPPSPTASWWCALAEEEPEDLRARLDSAHAAADRLVAEAEAAARAQAEGVPPRGWQAPGDAAGARRPAGDLQALAGVVELLRTAVPPELSRQLLEALRELLLAVRALIDFYLERLERRPAEEPEVQDIPID